MDKITRKELLELAEKTKIVIADSDVEAIIDQVSACLAYAVSVQKIAKEVSILSNKNSNHDRADVSVDYDSGLVLDQAPQHEDDYFVVPKILDN